MCIATYSCIDLNFIIKVQVKHLPNSLAAADALQCLVCNSTVTYKLVVEVWHHLNSLAPFLCSTRRR